jgi:DNA-binding Lrp family transcriptional regulator
MSWIEYAVHRSFLGSKCLIEWCIEGGDFLKEVEFKLVCELMKNSRRSDRELAKVLDVSQPTVSRMVNKLEKEGVIKEYTMMPDFTKLGFEIMSIDFAKLKEPISEEKLKEIRKQVRQTLQKEPISAIVAMSGMGCNADRVVVGFHEDYSTYKEHLNKLKQHPLVIVEEIRSFLINLNDRSQYLPLTLSNLADYITYKKRQKSEGTHKDSDN